MAGAQEIIFIDSAGFHSGDDIVVNIFICQVQNIQLGSAGFQRFFLQTVQFSSLSDVSGHSNNFRIVVVLFQPGDDDGRIQTAGIGENDLFDITFIHGKSSFVHDYATEYTPAEVFCQA